MAVIETTPETDPESSGDPLERTPTGLEKLLGTGDHTSIGRAFVGLSILFVLVSLVARALVGVDVITDNGFLGDTVTLLSRSGLVAFVFLGAIPLLLGIAIVVVPLQLGSPTIAFPRAAALSLWSWVVLSAVFLFSAVLDGGVGGGDLEAVTLGNVALAGVIVALGLGAVCVATTVMTHRPEGLTLARVPLFSWSMLVASSIWLLSFGSAVAWSVIAHLDSATSEDFLTSFSSGLGWLLRGPAVFMLAIPLLGIAGDVTTVATGRRLRHYGALQGLIGFFGIVSFGAWAPGVESVETVLWALFAVAATAATIAFVGGLMASIAAGPVKLTAAMVGALLSLAAVLVATVFGLLMALNTAGSDTLFGFDVVALGETQTIFVVAGVLVGAFAGLSHWSTKVWGSESRRIPSMVALWLLLAGGVVLGVSWAVQYFVNGVDGTTALPVFGAVSILGAALMVAGTVLAPRASVRSEDEDEDEVPEDPMGGATLEWQTPSPARAAERTAPVPVVTSPFPLWDLSDDKEAD